MGGWVGGLLTWILVISASYIFFFFKAKSAPFLSLRAIFACLI